MNSQSKEDKYLAIAIREKKVPPTCLLDGELLFFLIVHEGTDPCLECNMNRQVCRGRPRKEHREKSS